MAGNGVAVFFRHLYIGNDEAVKPFIEKADPFLSVQCRAGPVAFAFEKHLDEIQYSLIIVDDQYGIRHILSLLFIFLLSSLYKRIREDLVDTNLFLFFILLPAEGFLPFLP